MGIAKVILGIILIIIGLWLWAPYPYGRWWWPYFINVILGVLPIFLIFIGAILVWIESEEIKMERPRRPSRRPPRRRRR